MEQSSPAVTPTEENGTFSPQLREQAKVLIIRVLKFLQEFHRARTAPVLSLADQSWKLYFDKLPQHSLIQVGAHFEYLKQLFDDDYCVDGNFILRIGADRIEVDVSIDAFDWNKFLSRYEVELPEEILIPQFAIFFLEGKFQEMILIGSKNVCI